MDKRPNQFGVTVGSAQFTFSDRPRATPRGRSPQGNYLVAVDHNGHPVIAGSWVDPSSGTAPGERRQTRRSRRAAAPKAEPTGLRLYLRDVWHAILEVIGMACGPGRGNYSTWKTVKVASFRAWLTIKGYGDQGRCSNGRYHCGQCANCRIGEEWD